MEKNLTTYNKKRDFNKTNEPKGEKKKSKKRLRFVVQHHLARKDHYDLRLEWNGVLKSWAVPKGPSYKPKDKRLAVHMPNGGYEWIKVFTKGSYEELCAAFNTEG